MSPPLRPIFIVLLILGMLGLTAVFTGLSAATVGQSEETTQEWETQANLSMVAELDANGDARWTLSTVINISTQEELEAYRTVAADFENGDLPPLGMEAFESGLEGVNGSTEREMEIEDVVRRTATEDELENGTGRLAVEFTWVNFANEADGLLTIDRDVLVMDSGQLWLKSLSESQSLKITAPEDFGVRDSSVRAQNGELYWEGPAVFDETTLQATFIGTNIIDDGEGPSAEATPLWWFVLPLAIFGIAVAVLATQVERIRIRLPSDLGIGSPTASEKASETVAERPPEEGSVETNVTESMESESVPEEPAEIDEELLSDEERVERLLSSNGGRMKQADIVKETDWSNAKVSQLLSAMEEEDKINKLRIGRENLISFPDEDVTEIDE